MTDLSGVPAVLGGLGQSVGGLGQAASDVGGTALGAVDHLVQPGETVGAIAADHGVSVDAVMAANPQVLHPDIVEAGSHLSVPAPPSAPPDVRSEAALATTPQARPDAPPAAAPEARAEAPAPTAGGVADTRKADLPQATLQARAGAPSQTEAVPAGKGGVLESPLLAALPRETLSWRVQQQAVPGQPLVARDAATTSAAAGAAGAPMGVLLQALANDPAAAAVLAQLLGDGKSAILAVLGARLAAPMPEAAARVASGEGQLADATRQAPPGVDLAGREAVRADLRRAPVATGREAAESAQAQWIRRCAPSAVAVKGRWGVPAGFIIAHGALLSDWGRLAPGNDFFGLLPAVAPGAGRALVALAGPPVSGFGDLDEAADAFGGRLRNDGRYAPAFRAADAAAFAARAAAQGLTSDPLYAPAMQAVVEAHALARFD